MRRALALVLVAALLVACDGGNEEHATPTPSVAVATESATTTAERTPTPVATRPPVFRDQQVLIYDVASGEFTPLLPPLTDPDQLYFAYFFLPQFTPDGEHVWVAERASGTANRYNALGEVTDSLRGFVIGETESGALAYMDVSSGEWVVTVRNGGQTYALPEIGNRGLIGIAPDGSKVAYWRSDAHETVAVEAMSVADGTVLGRAGRVGLCQCDGGPGYGWSESGRYLTFGDFPSPLPNSEDPESGTFALDTVSGERTRLASGAWLAGTWLGADRYLGERDGWIVEMNPATGEVYREVAPFANEGFYRAAGGMVAIVDVTRDPYSTHTRVYEIESGDLLSEWPGTVTPIASTGAVALEQHLDGGGRFLNHPALPEPIPLPGSYALSPDGELLALGEGNTLRIHRIVDGQLNEVASYKHPQLQDWDTTLVPVEWNAQGTHLLIAIGFGL